MDKKTLVELEEWRRDEMDKEKLKEIEKLKENMDNLMPTLLMLTALVARVNMTLFEEFRAVGFDEESALVLVSKMGLNLSRFIPKIGE